MDEILANPYYAALVVLISQIIFIYLRTINVIYTAEMKVKPAIISGMGIGLAWLVSMAIGANSIMKGELLPILSFLIGGALGTYWGIRKEIKRHKREDK
jgi:hypothetical protein